VPHHEQQASECNGEQQHRELWPAYNPNAAPPQASTEGLFQQTQAISLRTPVVSVIAILQQQPHSFLAADDEPEVADAHGFDRVLDDMLKLPPVSRFLASLVRKTSI